MTIQKAYKYVYYKLYKHFEKGFVWMTEWKASLALDVLVLWAILSGIAYYALVTKKVLNLDIRSPLVLSPFIVIALINYFTFNHKDQWKEIIYEFDQIDKKRNRRGGWIVLGLVIFLLSNLIFSIYILSKVDWTKYY